MANEEADSTDSAVVEDLDQFDWDGEAGVGWVSLLRPSVTLIIIVLLIGGVIFDILGPNNEAITVFGWTFGLMDWMYWLSLLLIVVQVGVGAVQNLPLTKMYLLRFASSKTGLVAGILAILLFSIGTFIPIFWEVPLPQFQFEYQPPPGFEIPSYEVANCVGEIRGQSCYGSWKFPLGTDRSGRDLIEFSIFGLHSSLQVGIVATVLSVIAGTAIGTTAAYYGGWFDRIVMRFVDLMHAVPAFFVYALLAAIFLGAEGDIVVMTLVFGLLSWGGIARLVRSEVLQKVEEDYVKAARSAGASDGLIIRRHLLPNTANTIVTAASTLVPTFMLFEAALSYLDLGDGSVQVVSLGGEIAEGLARPYLTWLDIWWIWAVPASVLVLLLLSFTIAGDTLRDATDPRL